MNFIDKTIHSFLLQFSKDFFLQNFKILFVFQYLKQFVQYMSTPALWVYLSLEAMSIEVVSSQTCRDSTYLVIMALGELNRNRRMVGGGCEKESDIFALKAFTPTTCHIELYPLVCSMITLC